MSGHMAEWFGTFEIKAMSSGISNDRAVLATLNLNHVPVAVVSKVPPPHRIWQGQWVCISVILVVVSMNRGIGQNVAAINDVARDRAIIRGLRICGLLV